MQQGKELLDGVLLSETIGWFSGSRKKERGIDNESLIRYWQVLEYCEVIRVLLAATWKPDIRWYHNQYGVAPAACHLGTRWNDVAMGGYCLSVYHY